MNVARLLFYAVASFFLSSIAVATFAIGGASVFDFVLRIDTGLALPTVIVAITIVAPIVFLLLAVVEVFRPSDRP